MSPRATPTPATAADLLASLRHERDKYKAEKATHLLIPGVEFASKTECDRAGHLLALHADGRITDLRWHPRYVLSVKPSCVVTFDAYYVGATGQQYVEDTKPERAPISRDFRVRALWFRQIHPAIKVRVVTRGRGGEFVVASEF